MFRKRTQNFHLLQDFAENGNISFTTQDSTISRFCEKISTVVPGFGYILLTT